MTELKQEESQKEFFKEFSGDSPKPERFPELSTAQKPFLISASAEQLIFLGILAIFVLCLTFFLGVLRGKSLVEAPAVRETSSTPALRYAAPTAEPAAVPSAAIRPADPAKPYTIVLVTYKKKALAEREATALKKSGQPAFVSASGDYFVVCLGQYANINEAKKDLKIFGVKYKGPFLKRR